MYIQYEQRGQIGILTLDRPQALNAFNLEQITQLGEALDRVSEQDTRCLIITGAGEKAFAAGADIGVMLEMDQAQAKEWSLLGTRIFRKIETMPMPVIAAVNGFAFGGGCELTLACDIRLASENAVFSQPEVMLGVTAGWGGTQRLARLVGEGMAKELLYTGARTDATEALRIGLVNHIYPQPELMDAALKLAEQVAKAAPIAVRATKRALNGGLDLDVDAGLEWEADCFAECVGTNDQRNAMLAFVEKRKPEPFTNS